MNKLKKFFYGFYLTFKYLFVGIYRFVLFPLWWTTKWTWKKAFPPKKKPAVDAYSLASNVDANELQKRLDVVNADYEKARAKISSLSRERRLIKALLTGRHA